MKWLLIIASCCYPTTINTNVANYSLLAAPSAPSVDVHHFDSRADLEAFVLNRVIWGPCSESLVAVAPDGAVWTVKKTEKVKKVVREVEEHDGFAVEWRMPGGAVPLPKFDATAKGE